MAEQKPGWKHLPEGDVLTGGTAEQFKTGEWRLGKKPQWSKETCINCYFCWANCPDSAIALGEDNKVCGIHYDHCKGCGICAEVCPSKAPKAMSMTKEDK